MNTTSKNHGIELLDTDVESVTGGGVSDVAAAAAAALAPPVKKWGSVLHPPKPNLDRWFGAMVPVTQGPGTAVMGTAAQPPKQTYSGAPQSGGSIR